MNAPSNKPRDIKDLKARLGRTVQAGQPVPSGAPQGPGPGMPAPRPGASVPPPTVRSPFGAPMGPGGGLPAPAFAQPGARPAGAAGPSARPGAPKPTASAPPPAAARAGGSPFAAAAAPTQQVVEKKVRLVIDDSAVKDSEIGRQTSVTTLIVAGIVGVLGLGLGLGVGLTRAENNLWNLALHDAKDINTRINAASKTFDEATQ